MICNMATENKTTEEIEILGARWGIVAQVAAKLGLLPEFEFGTEDELRTAIKRKDATTLSLMDRYLETLLDHARACGLGRPPGDIVKLSEACRTARLKLIERTSRCA